MLQHALLWVPSSSDFFSFVARAPTSYFPIPRGSVSHFPTRCEGKRGFSDNFLFFLSPPIPSWPQPASPATLASALETRKGTPPLLNPFVSLPPSPSFCNAHSCLSPLLFSFRPAAAADDDDEGDSVMTLHSFFSLPSHARQQKEQDSRERERETVREASTHLPPPKKKRRTPFASKLAAAQSARQHKKIKREMGRRPPFRSLSLPPSVRPPSFPPPSSVREQSRGGEEREERIQIYTRNGGGFAQQNRRRGNIFPAFSVELATFLQRRFFCTFGLVRVSQQERIKLFFHPRAEREEEERDTV